RREQERRDQNLRYEPTRTSATTASRVANGHRAAPRGGNGYGPDSVPNRSTVRPAPRRPPES
ncbi:MAG: hypothetical protein WBA00_07795, partial [Rhodococcus sp. (in: high G+C Gram-positive bacteria)]